MKRQLIAAGILLSALSSGQAQDQGGRILEMLVRGLARAVVSENGSHIDPRRVSPVQPQRQVQPRVQRPVPAAPFSQLNRSQNRPVYQSPRGTYSQPTPGLQAYQHLAERFRSANSDVPTPPPPGLPYFDPPLGGYTFGRHLQGSQHGPQHGPHAAQPNNSRGSIIPWLPNVQSNHHQGHGSHHGSPHPNPGPQMKLTPILPPIFSNPQRSSSGHGDHHSSRHDAHGRGSHTNQSSPAPKVIGVNSPFGGILSGPLQGRSNANGAVRQQGRVILYRVR